MERVHDVSHPIGAFFDFEELQLAAKPLYPHAEAAGFGDDSFGLQTHWQIEFSGADIRLRLLNVGRGVAEHGDDESALSPLAVHAKPVRVLRNSFR
jgi:hypothetical protein